MHASSEHGIQGLTSQQVEESRAKFGRNEVLKEENNFFFTLKDIIKEPMFLLLLVASSLYFISGEIGDGIFMALAIVMVASISLYQESRSRNALDALKNLTKPTCNVIRNGETIEIKREDIVMGDCMVVEEGTSLPADGIVLYAHDFSVNESILTGESLSVSKSKAENENRVFQGTTVVSGLAICKA